MRKRFIAFTLLFSSMLSGISYAANEQVEIQTDTPAVSRSASSLGQCVSSWDSRINCTSTYISCVYIKNNWLVQ